MGSSPIGGYGMWDSCHVLASTQAKVRWAKLRSLCGFTSLYFLVFWLRLLFISLALSTRNFFLIFYFAASVKRSPSHSPQKKTRSGYEDGSEQAPARKVAPVGSSHAGGQQGPRARLPHTGQRWQVSETFPTSTPPVFLFPLERCSKASLAQLVEHALCKRTVMGSSPVGGCTD